MRPDRRDDRIYSRRSHPSRGDDPGRWEPEEHRFRGRPSAPSSNDYREDYGEDGRRDDEDFGNFQSYIGSGDGYGRGPTYRPGRFGDTSRYANSDNYYERGERWNRDDFDRTWSHRPERNVNEQNRHSFTGRDWRNSDRSYEHDDWRSYGERETRDYEEHRSHGEGLVDKMKSFFGVGPKGYRRSDERIHDEAAEALAHDERLDASDIDLKVENGVITLTGTVSDRWSKWRAEDRISHLFGVHDVKNLLSIDQQRSYEDQSILRYAAGHKGDAEAVGLGAQSTLNSMLGMGSPDSAGDATGTDAITGGPESTFGARGLEGTTSTGGFNNTVVVHPVEDDKEERSA